MLVEKLVLITSAKDIMFAIKISHVESQHLGGDGDTRYSESLLSSLCCRCTPRLSLTHVLCVCVCACVKSSPAPQ